MKTAHTNSMKRGQSSNDEWPEIIDVTRIGETIKVPTERPSKKPRRTIDIADISADDLESLHRQDPFLYYSIPGVRSATVLMKDIDESNLGEFAPAMRNCLSAPSRLETVETNTSSQPKTVERRTCVSFECHPDLLLAEELSLSDPIDDDDAENPEGDAEDGDAVEESIFMSKFMTEQIIYSQLFGT